MRLIDADGEYCINAMDNTGCRIDLKDGIGLLLNKHGQGICEFMLDDIPVAYDVDKVIKKLKEAKNPIYREDGSLMGESMFIRIDKAIEIVQEVDKLN